MLERYQASLHSPYISEFLFQESPLEGVNLLQIRAFLLDAGPRQLDAPLQFFPQEEQCQGRTEDFVVEKVFIQVEVGKAGSETFEIFIVNLRLHPLNVVHEEFFERLEDIFSTPLCISISGLSFFNSDCIFPYHILDFIT